jgi:hypothetical protein
MFTQHLTTGYSRRLCGNSIIVLLVISLPNLCFNRPRVQSRITGEAAAHSFLEAAEVRVVVVVNDVKKTAVSLNINNIPYNIFVRQVHFKTSEI